MTTPPSWGVICRALNTTAMYTEAQQDANWSNLTTDQKAYFNRLAENDPERTGQAFFEQEVPESLQDDPAKLEVFLNGGTVITEEWVPVRGRAGGEYVQVEHKISDKDWSHDVSRANGGSDSADNGRFEDSGTNRARGSRNTTKAEQDEADAQNEYDAEVLERGKIVDEVEEAATITAGFEASSLLAQAGEVALDWFAPAIGAGFAAKIAAEQFEKTEHKVAAGSGAAVVTAAVLMTPPGQLAMGGFIAYKLGKRAIKFFNKD